jgi:hypothetical protein
MGLLDRLKQGIQEHKENKRREEYQKLREREFNVKKDYKLARRKELVQRRERKILKVERDERPKKKTRSIGNPQLVRRSAGSFLGGGLFTSNNNDVFGFSKNKSSGSNMLPSAPKKKRGGLFNRL